MSNCVIYMDISAFMCYFSIRIINNGERRARIMINPKLFTEQYLKR